MQDERLQPPKDQPDLGAFLTVLIKAGRYATNWVRIDFDTNTGFGKTSAPSVVILNEDVQKDTSGNNNDPDMTDGNMNASRRKPCEPASTQTNRAIARLLTQGELIGRIFLVVQMPDIQTPQLAAQSMKINGVKPEFIGPKFGWTNSLGHALVNQASIQIGGALMDTIPGRLMEIIDEFQTPLEKVVETNRQLCRKDSGFSQTSFGNDSTSQQVVTSIPFWFSRGDPGCLLPIDALNVDEVRITIDFNPMSTLYYTDSRVTDSSGHELQTNTPGGSLWPMASSDFYYADPSGSLIPGLEPSNSVRVSKYPKVKMPDSYSIKDAYLMVEYIYLDKAEANRFRIADLQVPVVQHYSMTPVDNQNTKDTRIRLTIPNPTRDIFFYSQRYEAPGYNAHFLATRDLSGVHTPKAPWWPDAQGLDERLYGILKPGFSTRFSEPLRWLALNYTESLNRISTENVALFRSVIPSIEQRKAPWVNRYYYNIPLGTQNGFTPFSMPMGEANLDKVQRMHLLLGFHGKTGIINDDFVDRYITYVFAETYNIFRVYGGRGAMMFAY